MLGRAIGGLQWNTAICQGAANLHNRPAITRQHPFQRSKRPIDTAQISHFSHAPKFLGRHLLDRRKNRRHRVVDPDIDLAQIGFDLCSCRFDAIGIPNIHRKNERFASQFFGFFLRAFQAIKATRNQAKPRTVLRKFSNCCAPDSRGCSRNHNNFRLLIHAETSSRFDRFCEERPVCPFIAIWTTCAI